MKFGNSIFKTFFLSLCIVANTSFVYAQTASILPPAKTTFNDQNGKPLTSGTVDFYVPNTTTRKTTWQDSAETIPNTNPVTLDAAGRALILGDGSYRQIVKDRNGNLVWDQVTSSLGSGGSSGSTIGDGLSVGTILPTSGIIAPVNYQFAYGQSLSRASFPELLAALTYKTFVTCVGGSPTITGISDTSSISVGTVLESTCATGSPTVINKTINTVTLSANASVSTTVVGTFFIYGNGDALTTFNLPDLRGYTIAGRCNMGGVDCSNLNSTYFSVVANNTPSAINAKGGSQNRALSTGNLPPYTPTGTNAISALTASSSYGQAVGFTPGGAAAIVVPCISGCGANPSSAPVTGTAGAQVFTGNAQGGVSAAFSIVPPTLTLNYVIKVTPDTNLSSTFGVASIGGMTGIITCGAGLTCAGNSISAVPAGVTSIGGLASVVGVANGIVASGSNIQTAFTQTGTGAVTQTIPNKLLKGCVTPWDFTSSTIDNGVTNAQPAIQLALNTGKCVYLPTPATCYLVNSDLTMQAAQLIYGDGQDVKTLCVNSNAGFTNGLLNCNVTYPGNTFKDMRITYTQADPTLAFTGSASGTVLTVTSFAGGVNLAVGQFIHDPTLLIPIGTYIVSLGTGVGGNGTYNINNNVGTVTARAMSTPDNMRPQLTQYLPTFKCRGSPDANLANLLIEGAWIGGDFQGNAGRMRAMNVKMSAFAYGFQFDGALDTVRLDDFHFWPFGLTSNQLGVFTSSAGGKVVGTDYAVAVYAGRVDGLFMNGFLNFAYLGVWLFHGTTFTVGDCTCYIDNSNFDSFNGVVQNSGIVLMSNTGFSETVGPYNAYVQVGTNTKARLSNIFVTGSTQSSTFQIQNCNTCQFGISNLHYDNGSPSAAIIGIAATTVGSFFELQGGYISTIAAGSCFICAATPNSGVNNIRVDGVFINTTPSTVYTLPIFNIATNNRYTITNNNLTDKGAGGGAFFNNNVDCFCILTNNVAPGWTFTVPTPGVGFYSNNPH